MPTLEQILLPLIIGPIGFVVTPLTQGFPQSTAETVLIGTYLGHLMGTGLWALMYSELRQYLFD